MHPFSRAYRDQKSPLTPLTPLAENSAFTFNLSGDNTLKPFMQAIEIERAKENSMLSPNGIISSVKYVNPSKYMKSTHGTENTASTKKLSPRFVSTKKSAANDSGSHKSSGFMQADYKSVKSESIRSSAKVTCNSSSFDEASGSSSYVSNASGWTSYSSQNDTSKRRDDSSAYSSGCSNGSKSSFASSSSASSTCSTCGATSKRKGTSRYIPPKLVINETNDYNDGPSMSSIFNWVWNQLSPSMHNLTIYELLTRVGMEKYWDIFKREEIVDLDVFSTLTINDLKTIGIKNSNDCLKILDSVRMALDFLSGLLVLKKP